MQYIISYNKLQLKDKMMTKMNKQYIKAEVLTNSELFELYKIVELQYLKGNKSKTLLLNQCKLCNGKFEFPF